MNLPVYSLENKKIIYFFLAVMLIGGIYSFFKLPKKEDSPFVIKQAVLVTQYPGATPQEVEKLITEPIEREIQSMSDVFQIKSESYFGMSKISIELQPTLAPDYMPVKWDELRRKVANIQPRLPSGASAINVSDDFGDVFGIYYALTADEGFTYDDMRDWAQKIKTELTPIQGVQKVYLFAEQTQVVNVRISVPKLANLGINTIGVPGTIDLDISCTEYTIGFDTAVNTAMEAIDKVRDTSTSHERCSIIEVMGRNAGYIALWCGIANGAEDILLPENYDYDEQKIINNIIENRKRGKKHHIIVNAEGVGHSASMARRIEAATGIETRATILGHMQRGGSPTCKDRVYASMMGAMAADLLCDGKTNRVVGYQHGRFQDFDINEALNMVKGIDPYQYQVAKDLSKHC